MPTVARLARLAHRLPPSRAKGRVGRGLGILAGRIGLSARVVVALSDGTMMELDSRSRTEGPALWNGDYEADYRQVLHDLAIAVAAEPVVYDVGANVGLIGVPLARSLPGRVYCFEPVATNYAQLQRNIALNSLRNCLAYNVALGSVRGRSLIRQEAAYGETTGNAILIPSGAGPYDAANVTSVTVTPLDDIIREEALPQPDLIKLDVEGSEVAFLQGAQEVLQGARPIILGEFNSGLMPSFGTTFIDAAKLLPSNYAIFSFSSHNTLVEKQPYEGLGDVLLVPRERLGALPIPVEQPRPTGRP